MLNHAAMQRAQVFMQTQARPVERTLYAFFFADGPVADVYTTLAAHQNADGGFGHGLEPDVRTPCSSTLATSMALRWLVAVGAPPETPLVARALAYLHATLDAATLTWPMLPPEAQSAPHAPWWDDADGNLRANFGDFQVNPRAEIVAYLWHYAAAVPADWLAALTDATIAAIATRPMDMHDLTCATTLIDTPNLPESYRARILAPVTEQVRAITGASAADWQEYGPQPLNFATTPASRLAAALADRIPANLDFLLAEQTPSGTWVPNWSWGDADDPAWQIARRDWTSFLTLTKLRLLHAFGRTSG
jgi:hypothetical protein